ncbi:MAG: carbamoyltransferase [Pseudomonadota bacterium]
MYILGISAYYHDAAAALVRDGEIVAAAQEERFTRRKHDASFPQQAIRSCLELGDIQLDQLDDIVFYDKPLLKFERLIETYLSNAPRGFPSFARSMPIWLKEKLYLKSVLKKELGSLLNNKSAALPRLLFNEHHQSHAASAFFPSPFDTAAVLCLDGVGEWATTSAWRGAGNRLEPLWEIRFPHSLGLLYSAFTYYCGFKVNSGEYKLMGLAPYGEPAFRDLILEQLIDVADDGTFRLNMSFFDYPTGLRMTNRRFERLFGQPARDPETELGQFHMDLAASIQAVTELVVTRLARTVTSELGATNLCLAGGVALNCVANSRILSTGAARDLWIQPASGDAGGALGAALSAYHEYHDQPRRPDGNLMRGAFLGPAWSTARARQELDAVSAIFEEQADKDLYAYVADRLAAGAVVGWFQGRMEFGPRALGNRSILGDPRSPEMQSVMNLKIKFRESFRPFAPAVNEESAQAYFDFAGSSPYMLLVAEVNPAHRLPPSKQAGSGMDRINEPRSTIPAVTHLDYSARLQTVSRETNPRFHALIAAFQAQTGCPLLVNTSFNVRGEPLVCSPTDAYRCFMRTNMDLLVVDNLVLEKSDQPAWPEASDWRHEFELD